MRKQHAQRPMSTHSPILKRPFILTEDEIATILRYATEEYQPPEALRHFGVILAVLALTGARVWEVLGLRVADVDLRAGAVHIAPNQYRDLKSPRHARSIQMAPQMHGILRTYLAWPERSGDELLFPGPGGASEIERVLQLLQRCWRDMPMPARLERWMAVRQSASRQSAIQAPRRSLALGVLRRSWMLARLRRLAPWDREGLCVLAEDMGYSDRVMRRMIDDLIRHHLCGEWSVEFRW